MLAPFDAIVLVFLLVVLAPVAILAAVLSRHLGLWRQLRHLGRYLGARWWDAAGPLVLATGVVVLAALLGDVPDEGESGRLPFAFAGAALVVGVGLTTLALGNLDEYRQLAAGVDAAGTIDEGPAVVSGTATATASADEDALAGPISDEPALYYAVRVTEERGWGHRKAPVEVHAERGGERFHVDDGTGTVTVDPEGVPSSGARRGSGAERSESAGGTVRLWGPDAVATTSITVEAVGGDVGADGNGDGDLPPAVADLYERAGLDPDEERTITERRLPPGTDVTAFGTVAREAEARYPVVRDGDRRLAVIEGTADDVRASLRKRVKLGGIAGAVCLALGSVGVFLTAGVV